jgi:hypothetical protein
MVMHHDHAEAMLMEHRDRDGECGPRSWKRTEKRLIVKCGFNVIEKNRLKIRFFPLDRYLEAPVQTQAAQLYSLFSHFVIS